MPTYEYACNACGKHFDVVQSFSDKALTTCSECGGDLRKVFGAVGIVLKGSGFYKTDSRSSSGSRGKNGTSDGAKVDGETKSADSGSKSDSSSNGSSGSASGNGNGSGSSDKATKGSKSTDGNAKAASKS